MTEYVWIAHTEEDGVEGMYAFSSLENARRWLENHEMVEGLIYHAETEDWALYADAEGQIAWSIRRVPRLD